MNIGVFLNRLLIMFLIQVCTRNAHSTMETAIAETLFAIEEGEECISVIVGDVGLGKTLSIRMIIDSLEHEKYKIALVTNPSLTFVQLMNRNNWSVNGQAMRGEEKSRFARDI